MPRCAASRCVKWVRWRSKPRGLSGRARQPAQVRRIARQLAQNLQEPACPRLRCVSHLKWSRQIAFAGKRAPTMPAGPSPWVRPRSAAPPLAHSRLKPVPQSARGGSVGRLQPGRGHWVHPRFSGVAPAAFPAKAGPTVRTWCFSGTGFSREEAIGYTLDSAVWHLPLSRLKPVPQFARGFTMVARFVRVALPPPPQRTSAL